ncbi:MAG: hypothetical protein WBG92_10685 [Thiohalocapsa sp.]
MFAPLAELLDYALNPMDQHQAKVQLIISAPQPDCKLVEKLGT